MTLEPENIATMQEYGIRAAPYSTWGPTPEEIVKRLNAKAGSNYAGRGYNSRWVHNPQAMLIRSVRKQLENSGYTNDGGQFTGLTELNNVGLHSEVLPLEPNSKPDPYDTPERRECVEKYAIPVPRKSTRLAIRQFDQLCSHMSRIKGKKTRKFTQFFKHKANGGKRVKRKYTHRRK